jgi:hypothetical protein
VIDLTLRPGTVTSVSDGRRIVRKVFLWLANWWDGVDLWLSQLAFPLQFVIVIAVLAPVCFGLAVLVDRVVDLVTGRPTPPAEDPAERPVEPLVRVDVPAGTPATIITATPAPDDHGQMTATAGRGPESAGS